MRGLFPKKKSWLSPSLRPSTGRWTLPTGAAHFEQLQLGPRISLQFVGKPREEKPAVCPLARQSTVPHEAKFLV